LDREEIVVMNLDEYEFLWRKPDEGWVLFRLSSASESGAPRYVIENRLTSEAIIIEDAELYAAVKAEMLRRGVRVVGPGDP
jgi:hypothetical protein